MSSSRRMSDTNLELANQKLQLFAMSNGGDSSFNKRPSQSSNLLDQAMTTLLAMDKQHGSPQSDQISTHVPDRVVATDPGLRALPGPGTASEHGAQSQRGRQMEKELTPPPGPGFPQPARLPGNRCVGDARRLTIESETIAAAAASAAAGPPRQHRYHTCSAVVRGIRRKRVQPLSEPAVRALPAHGSAQSNWIDSTEDDTSSGARMSEAGPASGAAMVRNGSPIHAGKSNRDTPRPSLTNSTSSFVVDKPATNQLDPDDLRSQKTGRWYVLHPISPFRVVWDYLLVALVLASVLAVPLQLAFCNQTSEALTVPGTSLYECPSPSRPELSSITRLASSH